MYQKDYNMSSDQGIVIGKVIGYKTSSVFHCDLEVYKANSLFEC